MALSLIALASMAILAVRVKAVEVVSS